MRFEATAKIAYFDQQLLEDLFADARKDRAAQLRNLRTVFGKRDFWPALRWQIVRYERWLHTGHGGKAINPDLWPKKTDVAVPLLVLY